jgi:hypothetical protein
MLRNLKCMVLHQTTVNQAYFALHETLREVQNFFEEGTTITSEAFLSIS